MLLHKKKVFKSSRSAQKRRKQYAFRALAVVALFLLVLAGLGWASWWNKITISKISVVGNTTVPEEDVRNYIERRIEGGYLGIFSRANVFLFQPRVIEEELQDNFKKIKEVDVSRNSLQGVVVEIAERKPFYLWCGGATPQEKSETCYFLDIDGYVFAPAPYFSGHVYFEFYKKFEDGKESPVGVYFLPEMEFKRLIGFRNSLREIDLEPYAFTILETGDYSFLLSDGTQIFFNPKQDFDIVAHNLFALFDTEQFLRKRKSGASLEYIDLRFDNKVYYRFQ